MNSACLRQYIPQNFYRSFIPVDAPAAVNVPWHVPWVPLKWTQAARHSSTIKTGASGAGSVLSTALKPAPLRWIPPSVTKSPLPWGLAASANCSILYIRCRSVSDRTNEQNQGQWMLRMLPDRSFYAPAEGPHLPGPMTSQAWDTWGCRSG